MVRVYGVVFVLWLAKGVVHCFSWEVEAKQDADLLLRVGGGAGGGKFSGSHGACDLFGLAGITSASFAGSFFCESRKQFCKQQPEPDSGKSSSRGLTEKQKHLPDDDDGDDDDDDFDDDLGETATESVAKPL